MTTVAIMQPTYLPWAGYFDMLDQADIFVLLDNVPMAKQSWQTRNRVRASNGDTVWLTVPTHAHIGQHLNQVQIAYDRDWQRKHWKTVEASYGRAPHWADISLGTHGWKTLASLNEFRIRWLAGRLGITTEIRRASSLARQRHDKIGRLADILHSVDADAFLQTAGGRENLDGRDHIEDIPIRYHSYQHPIYTQGGAPFVSHLSVIDLIAWHGPASLEIIRSGRI